MPDRVTNVAIPVYEISKLLLQLDEIIVDLSKHRKRLDDLESELLILKAEINRDSNISKDTTQKRWWRLWT